MKSLLHLCAIALVIFFFPFKNATAYTLSSKSAVAHLEDLEKENKDIMKSLGKEYKAKVSVEQWNDGKNYFILHRNMEFARADMNGNIISYLGPDGNKETFFYDCQYVSNENSPESYYMVLRKLGNGKQIWSAVLKDGHIPCNLPLTKVSNIEGKRYFAHDTSDPRNKYVIYDYAGTLLTSTPCNDFTFISGDGKGKILTDDKKQSITFNWPDMPFHITGKTAGQPLPYTVYGPGKGQTRNCQNVIWRLCTGTPADGKSSAKDSRYVRVLRHYDNKGALISKDTVMVVNFTKPVDVMRTDNGDVLAHNVREIRLINNSGSFYYVQYNLSDWRRYVGLVNMADTAKNVPPVFADVAWIGGDKGALVQKSIYEPFSQYTPGTICTPFIPSEEEKNIRKGSRAYVNTSKEKITDSIAGLNPEEIKTVQADLIWCLAKDIDMLETNIHLAEADVSPLAGGHGHTIFSQKNGQCISAFARILPRFKVYADVLSKNAADSDLTSNLQEMIASAENFEKQAFDCASAYYDRRNMKDAEIAEKKRIEAAKKERFRKALEASKKNHEFTDQIKEAQAIVREGEQRIAAKKAARKAAESGYSSQSTSTSSAASTGEDKSGRKAFLKGQIIEWKNKLKKAEQSLESELASGSNDDWHKQQVVESKRNTVNECLQMIRQYEEELNSLK